MLKKALNKFIRFTPFCRFAVNQFNTLLPVLNLLKDFIGASLKYGIFSSDYGNGA